MRASSPDEMGIPDFEAQSWLLRGRHTTQTYSSLPQAEGTDKSDIQIRVKICLAFSHVVGILRLKHVVLPCVFT